MELLPAVDHLELALASARDTSDPFVKGVQMVGGASGNATGRNIHQRSLGEAVRLTKAISAITLGDKSVEEALAVFNGEADFSL